MDFRPTQPGYRLLRRVIVNRVAIVGASLAGVNAIDALRDLDYRGEIHLIGAEPDLPYTRPPLSKEALADGEFASDSLALREPSWYAEKGVDLHLGSRVTSLDTSERVVHDEHGVSHSYDGLVIATGSGARQLPASMIAPAARDDVFTLRTLADARRITERLERGRRLTVIGGGFVGMEVAATAAKLGVVVTVVDVAAMPMSRVFGPTIGKWFNAMHRRNGVDVRCSTSVERIEKSGSDVVVVLVGGERLVTDTVLVGIGGVPTVDWLAGSGVAVGNGAPPIYARRFPTSSRPVTSHHGTTAPSARSCESSTGPTPSSRADTPPADSSVIPRISRRCRTSGPINSMQSCVSAVEPAQTTTSSSSLRTTSRWLRCSVEPGFSGEWCASTLPESSLSTELQ